MSDDIETIAQACATLEVDIPSYQFGNYSEGGVSGMIYHADIRKLYDMAEGQFDDLCHEMFNGTNKYPKTIDQKVWAVIDMYHEEILQQMYDDDALLRCEDCAIYVWPNDYCGSCSKQIKSEEV